MSPSLINGYFTDFVVNGYLAISALYNMTDRNQVFPRKLCYEILSLKLSSKLKSLIKIVLINLLCFTTSIICCDFVHCLLSCVGYKNNI